MIQRAFRLGNIGIFVRNHHKKQEPICPRKSAPETQKVHHILSAICPLKVQKSTKKNTKLLICYTLQMALLCGFSEFAESCRNPNSIFLIRNIPIYFFMFRIYLSRALTSLLTSKVNSTPLFLSFRIL